MSTVTTFPQVKKLTLRRYLAARRLTGSTKEGAVQLAPSLPSRVDTITI